MNINEFKQKLIDIYKPFSEHGIDMPLPLADELIKEAQSLVMYASAQGIDVAMAQRSLAPTYFSSIVITYERNHVLLGKILSHAPYLAVESNFNVGDSTTFKVIRDFIFKNLDHDNILPVTAICNRLDSDMHPELTVSTASILLDLINKHSLLSYRSNRVSALVGDYIKTAMKCAIEWGFDNARSFFEKLEIYYSVSNLVDKSSIIDPDILLSWAQSEYNSFLIGKMDHLVLNHWVKSIYFSEVLGSVNLKLGIQFWENQINNTVNSSHPNIAGCAIVNYLAWGNSYPTDGVNSIFRYIHQEDSYEHLDCIKRYLDTHGVKNEERASNFVSQYIEHYHEKNMLAKGIANLETLGLPSHVLKSSKTAKRFITSELGI